jgi:two-component system, LuxR family, sensor kinase FixL
MDHPHHIPPEQDDLLMSSAQIGRIMNGIAHDINNYLGVIMSYAELIESESNLNLESRRMIGEMTDAVELCSRMLGTLTTVSRQATGKEAECDAIDLMNRVAELFDYDVKLHRLRMLKNFHSTSLMLHVDEVRLQRILMYLLSTGIEIARETKTTVLTVSAFRSGTHVVLAVGLPGMDLSFQVTQGLLNTFYTFPESGRTIPGLSAAANLASGLGGELGVSEEHGLQIRLPVDETRN